MIKKILVPFDGSKLAEKILPQVEEMAKSLQAKIILITVGSLLWAVPAAESGLRGAEEFAAQKKIEAEKKSLEVVEALKVSGLRVSYVYRESFASAAQDILSYAENNGCDLIAMATHGKGESGLDTRKRGRKSSVSCYGPGASVAGDLKKGSYSQARRFYRAW